MRNQHAGAPDAGDRRPLVVTTDDHLLDEVLRVCAGAGVTPFVVPDLGAARSEWGRAPLVVVGVDAVVASGVARTPRRADVALVAADTDDAAVWVRAVEVGADRVIGLPRDGDVLARAVADCVDTVGGEATQVAVIGGSGGAGASCLAGALALAASRAGTPTLLVDADPLGGGIDMVVGNEAVTGLRWPDLAGSHGHLSGASLRAALPFSGALSVLSWDRSDLVAIAPETTAAALEAGRRAHEVVVVDLPRRLDDAVLEVVTTSAVVLLVVRDDVRSVAAAAQVRTCLGPSAGDLRVVLRSAGGSSADLVAETLGLPVAAVMRDDPRSARAIDAGAGPSARRRSPLMSAARGLAGTLFAESR